MEEDRNYAHISEPADTYIHDGDEDSSSDFGYNNETAGDWCDSNESESAEERNQNDDQFKMAEGLWDY
ncbi:hypothetical protein IMZ48_15515 [Candidatus Bathyarchaeota archaeon]|nr:hypothetical protein [Candidatus Bathyarchaeota archaeon]